MKHGVLGVSWLNDQLAVVWLDERGQLRKWIAPGRVPDFATLRDALARAREEGGFKARRARLVLDHRNLLFHVQETPPGQGRVVDQVLERLVGESRFFDERAVWTRLELPAGPQRQRWLLALMPQSLLEEIEIACLENQLQLEAVHPLASALTGTLTRAAMAVSETVLLITNIGESHSLILGHGNGQLLFARSIAGTADPCDTRLEQEINRTLHFCQQRFGSTVTRLVGLGSECHAHLSGRTLRADLKLETLAMEPPGSDPGEAVTQLRRDSPLNFVRSSARLPAWASRALTAAAAALFLLCAATAVRSHEAARQHQRDFERAAREWEMRSRVEAEREHRRADAAHLELIARAIGRPEDPGVAASFARYLTHHLPVTLRLTSLEVRKATNGWGVHLEGRSREHGSAFLTAIEELENALGNGLFRLQIVDSTHRRTVAISAPFETPTGFPFGEAFDDRERAFFVTGVIQ
jgi:hypothetical protein